MTVNKVAAWAHAEELVSPSPSVERASRRAGELGATEVGPGAGAALRVLAAATGAKAVMQLGSGTGVGGLWLLEGMPDDGVLTTIDIDPEHQRAARAAYAEAGVSHTRTRVIAGRVIDVLPRMATGAYDLVVVDGDRSEYPAHVEQAIRLLRSGGTLALVWSERVADPAARDAETAGLRDIAKRLLDDEDFVTALLPVSTGLLVAVKR